MDPSRLRSAWQQLTRDTAFRVGTVYAGGSWFVIEAIDTLGGSTAAIRTTAAALAAGFFLVVPAVWILERRGRAAATAVAAPDTATGGAVTRGRGGSRRWAVALFAVLALSLGAWWAGGRFGAPVPAAATHIAVLPFHATGSDAARELGTGLVDLLSAAMDDVAGIRTVNSRSVLARAPSAGAGPLALDDALDLGRRLGAGSILTGSITAVAGRVRLIAEIRSARDATIMATAEAEGAEADVLSVADQLAVRLLRAMWRSSEPIPAVQTAALTTTSPAALRYYLAGERHLRGMRTDSATDAFRAAVAEDSTFALAWLRLTESTGWSTGEGLAEDAAERKGYIGQALRFADRLPARSQAMVRAAGLVLDGDLASFDSLDAYVTRYPDDPYGWYLLGDARFHAAPLGLHATEQIVEPFVEATRLDPSFALGLVHPIELALDIGDQAEFSRLLEHYATAAPAATVDRYRQQARVRWAPADSILPVFMREVRALETGAMGPLNLLIGVLGNRVRLDGSVDPMTYVAAMDSIAHAFPARRAWQLRAQMLAGMSLMALGRTEEGLARGDRWLALEPPAPPFPPHLLRPVHRVSRGLEHVIPPELLREDLELLEANVAALPFIPDLLHFYYLTVGDGESADRFPLTLEVPPDAGIDTVALRMATEGWDRLLRGDTLTAAASLDGAIRRTGFRNFGVVGPAMMPFAELLASRPATRDRGIRMLRRTTVYSAVETGRAFLALARALEDSGDVDGARGAYAQVVRLWDGADPHRQDAVREARAALARLTAEG
jgi:TolB-like protein